VPTLALGALNAKVASFRESTVVGLYKPSPVDPQRFESRLVSTLEPEAVQVG
jgi:hypothetical protein